MRLFCSERKVYTIRAKILILALMLFVSLLLILFVYNTCYSGTIKEKAKIRANTVVVSAINKAVDSVLSEQKLSYNNFFDINVKEDKSVSYMAVNTVTVNKFKVSVTQKILETLNNYEREEIFMSPFSVYGYTAVPFGIMVPVLVIPVEILSTDFCNDFQGRGVNQTLHRLYVKIKINIKLLLPVGSEEFVVETGVPVAETVIVGDIPDTYTNVEGITEPGSDAILNLAP